MTLTPCLDRRWLHSSASSLGSRVSRLLTWKRCGLSTTNGYVVAHRIKKFAVRCKGCILQHCTNLFFDRVAQVFALLRSLAEPDAQMSSLRKQRIDVLKRLGSKSPQAALVKQLLRYASMTSVDVNSIEHICSIALGAGAHADGTGRGGGGGAKKKSRAAKRSNKARAAGGASADTELEVMADHEVRDPLLSGSFRKDC